MENKEKETSKTTDKKTLETTKKYLEEQLKDPGNWALSLAEAWIKKMESLPFNLSDRIKNKSESLQLSQNEKEKFIESFPSFHLFNQISKSLQLSQNEEKELLKAIVEFFIEDRKFQEMERKIEKEFLLFQKKKGKKIKLAGVNGGRKDLPPTKFEEVNRLPYIPIDRGFYEIMPYIIPYRLSETSLVYKEILKDNSLALKYKIETRGKSIIFNFLIPPEVLGKIKEKDIPTVGVNMRRSLYSALAFAFVQNTASPNFKRSELLKFMGEDTQKRSKLYSDLDKGLLTWAYGTYAIISGNKISEVGHIVEKVKLAKKRGDRTLVKFNPDVVKPLFRSQMDTESLRYIAYPTDLLKVKPKEMKLYLRNFCESLLKKKGMGREVYPKYVKNILVQDFGIPSNKLGKLSNKQIHNIFIEGANEAKHRGLLEDYTATVKSQKKAPYNMREWKIKLIVSSRPENDS